MVDSISLYLLLLHTQDMSCT